MDGSTFDDLAKKLSATTTRREAVRLLGGTLAAGALGALFPGRASAAGNSTCAKFCASTFGADTPAAKQCTSDAAMHRGLCYSACGPLGAGGGTLIGGTCCPSANVCGSTCLAAPCDTSQCLTCDQSSGTCVSRCSSGQGCCNGTCTALNTTQNCGACGNACVGGQTCQNGTCVAVCPPYPNCSDTCPCPSGQSCCSGMCVDEQTDAQNCGACGNDCAAQGFGGGGLASVTCASGQCTPVCLPGAPLCVSGTFCCSVGDTCTGLDFCCPAAQYCFLTDTCCEGGTTCLDGALCG